MNCNAALYITARFPVEIGIIDAISFVKPRLTVNSYLPPFLVVAEAQEEEPY